MSTDKVADVSTSDDDASSLGIASGSEPAESARTEGGVEQGAAQRPALPPWAAFSRTASDKEVKERFSVEVREILTEHAKTLAPYCCLAILQPEYSIGQWDLDQIFTGLTALNPKKDKDVLLLLLSGGGSIEPAYQISKLCKQYARRKFVVCVPRQAKSAATLLAIGADEIHMGVLGQLGPIDPQLGGLPALGVAKALETIASLAERFPGSAEMLARYLQMALTVEQIGYCDRISESAVQYAERLLATKPSVASRAGLIAKELVHEYKDHSFVIDLAEAQQHLGSDWVKTGTPETEAAERIYNYFDMVNLFLGVYRSKRLAVMGRLDTSVVIFDKPSS